MKKSTLTIIIVCAVLAIIALWGVSVYNQCVTAEENVENIWGNVEAQYQRRADLIPNLVNTVKGYASYESSTLESVMEARAKATSVTIDPSHMTEDQLKAFQSAQTELSAGIGKLLAVAEAYPDLKASQNFRDLQAQLEGTENRIAVARQTFNDTAKTYNTLIRRFPSNLIAGMFGFEKKPYFEAEEGADKAPEVAF